MIDVKSPIVSFTTVMITEHMCIMSWPFAAADYWQPQCEFGTFIFGVNETLGAFL